jgi:hypothetical protein
VLTDDHPVDHAFRVRDLLHSEAPEEQAQGVRELEALRPDLAPLLSALQGVPPADLGKVALALFALLPGSRPFLLEDALYETLYEAAKRTKDAPLGPPLPDTPWQVTRDSNRRNETIAVRRFRGHVLVVRESGAKPGMFYGVVDGHHLSAHGSPWAWSGMDAAKSAVMSAARDNPPSLADKRRWKRHRNRHKVVTSGDRAP